MKIKDVEKWPKDRNEYYPDRYMTAPYDAIEKYAKDNYINNIQAAYEMGRIHGMNAERRDIERSLLKYRQAERKKRVKAAINVLKQDAQVDIEGLFKL